MLTFERFQASKRWSDDLATDISSANWGTEGTPKGWIYCDDLHIEQVQDFWPEATRKAGKWYLMISNCEWATDDLESLERRLYDFAVSEGYCEAAA